LRTISARTIEEKAVVNCRGVQSGDVALLGISSVQSHLCTLSPVQRGNVSGLNTPAVDNCLLLDGPCGDRPQGPVQTLFSGSQYNVIFQINEAHYNESYPGNITFTLIPLIGEPYPLLQTMEGDETNLKTGTLVTLPLTIPEFDYPFYGVLQIIWYTNVWLNSEILLTFHQCSDIQII